jgi:hypothetical protein
MAFDRYVGIDYSGAQTPSSSLPGLQMYIADRVSTPVEIPRPAGPRKYWTRREIAERLVELLGDGKPTLIGIDHGFSFPLRYFEKYNLPLDWGAFLEDFQQHWPTDDENTYVDFVRDGVCGNGAARTGRSNWRRIAEIRSRAKSVFHFNVQGSVAKSTHSGLPWLRYIRSRTDAYFWPFDGWQVPPGRSAVAEVYPALWSRSFPQESRNSHQHDAYSIAAWLRRADLNGSLAGFLEPDLDATERKIAEIEGWILGVL